MRPVTFEVEQDVRLYLAALGLPPLADDDELEDEIPVGPFTVEVLRERVEA